MEDHICNLQKLCRLCGKPSTKKKTKRRYIPFPVTNYEQIVAKVYEFDCKDDDPEVHPNTVCESCNVRLKEYQKKQLCDLTSRKDKLQHFLPHSDTCTVCFPLTQESTIEVAPLRLTFANVKQYGQSKKLFLTSESSESLDFVILLFPEKKPLPMELHISSTGHWSIKLGGHQLDNKNCSFFANSPILLNDLNYAPFLDFLLSAKVCPGNDDFPDVLAGKLALSGKGTIISPDGAIKAFADSSSLVRVDSASLNTLRDSSCDILISSNRCLKCASYRNSLFAMRSQSRQTDKTNPKCNDRYMSMEDLKAKVKFLEQERIRLTQKTLRLQDRIRKDIKEKGIYVEESTSKLLKDIVSSEVHSPPFEPDSPQFLLWDEQRKQASLKDPRSMRWHPLMIRWCLSIYLKSPGTYKFMRSTPFIQLPCIKTLSKYINFTDPGCGFNPDIISRLASQVGLPDITDSERYINLCFDEMKVKSGLVYNKSTGQFVGFTDMGDINQEVDLFQRSMAEEMEEREIATHVVLFMARGICSRLHYSLGHFATNGFDSHQLFPIAWEAVKILEAIGLRVVSMTSDGATPNRKFYKIHRLADGSNVQEVIYWTYNPFSADRRRKIYFFSDVPHLMKTTRNNLENSHSNKNTRNLMVSKLKLECLD